MTTLRVYDLDRHHVLAVDLRHILDLLAPHSLLASWTISTVKSANSDHEWFEATRANRDKLEMMAQADTRVSGPVMAELAQGTRQVIWGEFVGSLPEQPGRPWLTIRAVDSTFYEITSEDKEVVHQIRSAFKDVRIANLPIV